MINDLKAIKRELDKALKHSNKALELAKKMPSLDGYFLDIGIEDNAIDGLTRLLIILNEEIRLVKINNKKD